MAIHFRATSYQVPTPPREGAEPDRWTPFEAPIGDAYVQAVEAHMAKLDMAALATAVLHRDVPAIVELLEFNALDTRLQMTMTAPILDAFEAGEEYGRTQMPGAPKLHIVKAEPSALLMDFGVTNELATAYAQQHIGDLITHISDSQLGTIRDIIGGQGFGVGAPINSLAKQIAGTVGLNAPQGVALAKYSDQQWANTFAGNPKMSPAVQKKIDAAQGRIDKYEQRLLRQRGEMIARTEVIRASTQGQLELWKEGQAAGYVAKDANKVWVTTVGACPLCSDLEGTVIAVADKWAGIGEDGPPAHPNCRCGLALAPVGAQQTGAGAGTTEAGPTQAEQDAMAAQTAEAPYDYTPQEQLDREWERGLITLDERDRAQGYLDQGKLPEELGGHNKFAYETEIVPETGKWILRNVVTGDPRVSTGKGEVYYYATEKAALSDAARQGYTVGGEPAPPKVPAVPRTIKFEDLTLKDVRSWTPIDGPKGYNPGQWYQDPHSDRSVFLKEVPNAQVAGNEVAVGKTYEALGAKPGIDIPKTTVLLEQGTATSGDRAFVLGEKMNNLTTYSKEVWNGTGQAPEELRAMAHKLWAGDALTSNWDVIGNNPNKGYDNLLARTTPDGTEVTNVVRIDMGGGGLYRGVGSLKPSFQPGGDWVDPWTMRGQTTHGESGSDQGKAVFGSITDKEAQKLLKAMATRLNETRLAALDMELRRAGVTNYTRNSYMETIRARVAQVPQVVEALKPQRPLTGTTAKGLFKVPAGQAFPDIGRSSMPSRELERLGQKVVDLHTDRDVKNNSKFYDSQSGTDIVNYWTTGSADLARYERQDTGRRTGEDAKYKARAELLDKVFDVSHATDYFTVHSKQGHFPVQDAWREGSSWVNPNGWSTSIGEHSAWAGEVTIHIQVPRGAPVIFAMPISSYTEEREMITPRGMRLTFTKITRNSYGKVTEAFARYDKYDPAATPLGKSAADRPTRTLADQAGDIIGTYGIPPEHAMLSYLHNLEVQGKMSYEQLDALLKEKTGLDANGAYSKYSGSTSLKDIAAAEGHVKGAPVADLTKIGDQIGQPHTIYQQYAQTKLDNEMKSEMIAQFEHIPTMEEISSAAKLGLYDADAVKAMTGTDSVASFHTWVENFPAIAKEPLWTEGAVTPAKAFDISSDKTYAQQKAAQLSGLDQAQLVDLFGHPPSAIEIADAYTTGDLTAETVQHATGNSPSALTTWVEQFPEAGAKPLWEAAPFPGAQLSAGKITGFTPDVKEFTDILAHGEAVSAEYKAILEKEFMGHVPTADDVIKAYVSGDHPMSPDSVQELTGKTPGALSVWVDAHPTAAKTPLWDSGEPPTAHADATAAKLHPEAKSFPELTAEKLDWATKADLVQKFDHIPSAYEVSDAYAHASEMGGNGLSGAELTKITGFKPDQLSWWADSSGKGDVPLWTEAPAADPAAHLSGFADPSTFTIDEQIKATDTLQAYKAGDLNAADVQDLTGKTPISLEAWINAHVPAAEAPAKVDFWGDPVEGELTYDAVKALADAQHGVAGLNVEAAKLIDFGALADDGSSAVKQGLLTAFDGEVPTPAQVLAMWKSPEMLGSGMHAAMDTFTGFTQEQFQTYMTAHPDLLNAPMWGPTAPPFPPPTEGSLAPVSSNALTYPGATWGSVTEADKLWLQGVTGVNNPTAYDLMQAYELGKIEASTVQAMTGFMPGQIGEMKMGTPAFATVNQTLWPKAVVSSTGPPNPNYIYASQKIDTATQVVLFKAVGGSPTASNLYHLWEQGTLTNLIAEGKVTLPYDPNTGHSMSQSAWIKALTGYTTTQIAGAPGAAWTLAPL